MWNFAFPEWLLNISNYAVLFGTNIMVQSTILVTTGLCTTYVFRKKGAVFQSLILRGFLAAVLICPLINIFFHAAAIYVVTVDIPMASLKQQELTGYTFQQELIDSEISEIHSLNGAIFQNNRAQVYNNTLHGNSFVSQINYRSVFYIFLTSVWVFFTGILLIRLVFFYLRILYIRLSAIVAEPAVLEKNKDFARQLNIEAPLVLQSPLVKSPFLTGIFKPAVLLPEGITVTGEIIVHELAHLLRRDNLFNMLSHLCNALMPFQPLLRILSRRIEDTADFVCDDYVVKLSSNPRFYAFQLYNLAERFQPAAFEAAVGVGIISFRSGLHRRIERILGDSRQILVTAKAHTVKNIAILCLGAAVLTGFIGFRGTNTIDDVNNAIDNTDLNKRVTTVAHTDKKYPEEKHISLSSAQKDKDKLPDIIHTIYENVFSDEKPIKKSEPRTDDNTTITKREPGIEITSFQSEADWGIKLPSITKPEKDYRNSFMDIAMFNDHTGDSFNNIEQVAKVGPEQNGKSEKTVRSDVPDFDPDTIQDIDSCKKIGKELLESGCYARAEKVFHRAMEFDSEDPEVRNYLGLAYWGKRENDLAILNFKLAVSIKPDYADAYYNLGRIIQAQGDPEGAWSYYKVAININPAYARERHVY